MVPKGRIRGVARREPRRKGLEGVVVGTKPSRFGFISIEDWEDIEKGMFKDIRAIKKSVKSIEEIS